MEIQNTTIDNLIEKLRTKEGRAVATVRSLDIGLQVGDRYRQDAMRYFLRIGDYSTAIKMSKEPSETESILAHYKPTKRRRFELRQQLDIYSPLLIRSFLGVSFEQRFAEMGHEEIQIAKKAEEEGRHRSAKYHYKQAVEYLMIGRAFGDAYELAIKYGFTELFNKSYIREIKILEKSGLFGECARLEQVRGNVARAQIYQKLDTILRSA